MEKQLDLGPLSLPGALGINPTLPIPSFLFTSLLEKLRDEAGEALQELGAGTQLHLGRHPTHSVPLTRGVGVRCRDRLECHSPAVSSGWPSTPSPAAWPQPCYVVMLPPSGHTGKTQPTVSLKVI